MTSDIPVSLPSSHTTRVDLGGLMSVLAKHLYSTPEVAVRELVQNAHDSLVRRRLEDAGWQDKGSIRIAGDLAGRMLTVTDVGAGLTEDEIHRYLATVGLGYTRTIREKTGSDELIGLFGLGFLSAFVLAEQVTLRTTSYTDPSTSWCYQSSDGKSYTVRRIETRPEVGTEIQIQLRPEFKYIAASQGLHRILSRYCALLSEPIYIGDSSTPLNDLVPPWRHRPGPDEPEEHPVERRRRQMEFAERFDDQFKPICTISIEPHGRSDARGILWVQDGRTYGTSDNRKLSVFVRGMLLDDDARDLLPVWAGFVGGVIESSQLTPTASREDLQRDEVYKAVQETLTESLVTGLGATSRDDPSGWRRVLSRHNEPLLGASLCDVRLFHLLADQLTLPTSQGDMAAHSLRVGGKLHVAVDATGGFEEMLCRALQMPVAHGERYAVIPFLRQWTETHGGQLVELGTDTGNRQMFKPAHLEQGEIDWLTERLCDGEQLVPAHFAPAELPLVLVPDREAELKKRLEADEAEARISAAALRLARTYTSKIDGSVLVRLYVNLANPAVQGLLQAHKERHPAADTAARVLWSLKVIVGSGGDRTDLDFNKAFAEMGEGMLSLVGKPTRV